MTLKLYNEYLKLTGDPSAAALLVHAQTLSSFDETLLSIYEDAKKYIPGSMLKRFLA